MKIKEFVSKLLGWRECLFRFLVVTLLGLILWRVDTAASYADHARRLAANAQYSAEQLAEEVTDLKMLMEDIRCTR